FRVVSMAAAIANPARRNADELGAHFTQGFEKRYSAFVPRNDDVRLVLNHAAAIFFTGNNRDSEVSVRSGSHEELQLVRLHRVPVDDNDICPLVLGYRETSSWLRLLCDDVEIPFVAKQAAKGFPKQWFFTA